MNVELEKEISKLSSLKKSIEEMGASLWQTFFRKRTSWIRMQNAGTWILGWF